MTGIYRLVESLAFAPHIIRQSFADVGLWPWNPEKIRNLCREHCPPPSQLNGSHVLRKLERIMKNLSVEQETERDKITAIGRFERLGSTEEGTTYQLRERKTHGPTDNVGKPRRSVSGRKSMSSEIQPPAKRSRTMVSTK